jgi:glycerophosphoryl diester phosphodiesterase
MLPSVDSPVVAPLPSMLDPPLLFAHRGARAHAPENTIEAFELGLRLGATGLESDAWLTADGVVVLDHDGKVKAGARRRSIARSRREQLPPHIPTLADLYRVSGAAQLSLDVKDPHAFDPVIAVAREAGGPGALERLWLCHADLRTLETWRSRCADVRLVNSTRLQRLDRGPERRAAELADAGIDAINLHHSDWTGGLTTLFHRFDRVAFGWDAQHERILHTLLGMGIDGVYSDWVDRMVDALRVARS